MLTKSHRPWLAALGVIPLALTLTGCFGGPAAPNTGGGDSDVDDELVEDIVEGANGDDVDFESDSLPEGFPVDEIPLVPGDVGPSFAVPGSDGTTSYQITIIAADEQTANTADELLVEAGFSNESVIGYEKGEYLVVIVGTQEYEDGGWAVSYLVTQP